MVVQARAGVHHAPVTGHVPQWLMKGGWFLTVYDLITKTLFSQSPSTGSMDHGCSWNVAAHYQSASPEAPANSLTA